MTKPKRFHACNAQSCIEVPDNKIPCLALLTVVLLQCSGAFGQALDYAALEEFFEEPVTASVTGSPQRATEVPATMDIISAEQIRRSSARDIPGVLRQVTGLNVYRWTNNGADVSIRGYNSAFSPRLLVMINGRQVYADHYGYVPWSTLPVALEEIHQIEIVKGPNSALFGFNAVAGVINIITVNPLHEDQDFINVRTGTQNLVEGAAALTWQPSERSAVKVSLRGGKNDDFSTPLPIQSTGVRVGDERTSGLVDVHFQPADHIQVELEGSWSRADQTNMAPNYALAFEETQIQSFKAMLTVDSAYGLIEATAYQNSIDNDVFATTTLDGVNYFFQETPLLVLNNDLSFFRLQDIFKPAAAHTLRLSGEFRRSSMNTAPFAGAEVSYDVFSGSGMWQWQINDDLSLTSAVRFDRLDMERKGIIPEGLFFSNEDWDRRLSETSFNAGLVWHADDNNTLRVMAARGVQLPSLYNLGGSLFGFEIPPEFGPPFVLYSAGVPTLSPSTVDSTEIAWDRHFPGLDMDLRVALFRGDTKEVISDSGGFDIEAGIFSSPINIGDSETQGAELSLRGSVGDSWRWGLGYVYQEIEDNFGPQYPPEFTLRKYEDLTPSHIVNANLGWNKGPWQLDGYLRYESSMMNLRPATDFFNPVVLFPVDDFVILDARAAYRVNERVQIELSGQNLLHSEQEQHTGPAVERKVYLGLLMKF